MPEIKSYPFSSDFLWRTDGGNIRLDAEECTVIADRMRLSQVVQNYLSSAIRYSPPDDEVVVQLVVAPDLVSVCVKDSGGGIQQSDQALLFSKFFPGWFSTK